MRMGNEYAVERTMGSTESGKCQSKTHKTYRDTLTLWIVAFIMIAGLSIALEAIWYPPTIRVNSQNRNFTRALRSKKVIRYGESLKNTEVMTTILFMTILMK